MDVATLTMPDGVRVVVPDNITQITSYVLAEQQDWFEDELRFVRLMLQPGQTCIDIGAGLGVYSLSMARKVGPTGAVIAFEPFSTNADLIAKSIELNELSWIQLDRRAVSEKTGSSKLILNSHSESNSIYHPERDGVRATIPIEATTLDDCVSSLIQRPIDFIKIDAEGEEAAIIRGASQVLTQQSPVILFEIRSTLSHDLRVAAILADFGYRSYRLIPGLNVLVEVDLSKPIDNYILNLLACKPETAAQLAERGLLIRSEDLNEATSQKLVALSNEPGPHDYRQWLTKMPYGQSLAKDWKKTMAEGKSGITTAALNLYGIARDFQRPPVERYLALTHAYGLLGKLCETREVIYARNASLARIAMELGQRVVALNCLGKMLQHYHTHRRLDVTEPFLAPSPRYDYLPPREAIGSWLIASATEAFELARHYSSFYSESDTVERLESIRDLGYASEATTRRLSLYQSLQVEKKKKLPVGQKNGNQDSQHRAAND